MGLRRRTVCLLLDLKAVCFVLISSLIRIAGCQSRSSFSTILTKLLRREEKAERDEETGDLIQGGRSEKSDIDGVQYSICMAVVHRRGCAFHYTQHDVFLCHMAPTDPFCC